MRAEVMTVLLDSIMYVTTIRDLDEYNNMEKILLKNTTEIKGG